MEMLGFILFGVAAVAAVVLFVLRNQDVARATELAGRSESLQKELAEIKSAAGSRKDTLESRTQELTELKDKLRDVKKRLHEEKETHRKQEIAHARAEAERDAQAQVEAARQAAAEAQQEVRRLQAELELARGKKRPEPVREVKVELAAPAAEPAAPAEPAKPRELTKVEQDRISLLERQAVKQAERVKQLEEEAKRHQRRAESTDKAYKVAKSEIELGKSKMTAVEKRLNKTLLELDKLRARAFQAGLANEIVAAQSEADAASPAAERNDAAPRTPASTSPADTPLPEAEA